MDYRLTACDCSWAEQRFEPRKKKIARWVGNIDRENELDVP
jgi:hypothetical protein